MHALSHTHPSSGLCRRLVLPVVLVLAVLTLVASVPAARADATFCELGSGAGQCSKPGGVAVDFETKRVYVADSRNNRVDVFEIDEAGGQLRFLFAFGWGVDTGAAALEKCTAASGCQAGIAGSGAGQFGAKDESSAGIYTGIASLAVDNDPASSSHHAVYVFDRINHRLLKFSQAGAFIGEAGSLGSGPGEFQEQNAVAVGPAGEVYVIDRPSSESSRLEKFGPALTFLGECELSAETWSLPHLAVDSEGDLYTQFVSVSAPGVFRVHPDCSEFGPPYPVANLGAFGGLRGVLSVDSANSLFVAGGEGLPGVGLVTVIGRYDSSGRLVRRFGYGPPSIGSVAGLAAISTSLGEVIVSDQSSETVRYIGEPNPGPVTPSLSVRAAAIGNTKATLGAAVNPEGKETAYRFEYLTRAELEAQGGSFEGPSTRSTPTVSIPVATGEEERFSLRPVSALVGCTGATRQAIEEGECLRPETEYVFRAVATNADNPSGAGAAAAEGAFTTAAPLEAEVFATEVSTDTATLNARVDPLGIPATGRFEYVTQQAYEQSGFADAVSAPAGELDFGGGEGWVKRSLTLYPLTPGTAYRYRLSASDALISPARIQSAEGTFATFATGVQPPCPGNEAFRSGPSAFLPDCRAYEMVSPLEKEGGDIVVLQQIFTLLPSVVDQSAAGGERVAFGSYRSFGDAASAPYTSQYVASRDPEAGWQTHAISPPEGRLIRGSAELDFEFRAFSQDLCEGWIGPFAEPPLAEGAIAGYHNLYRRTDQSCGATSYTALTTARAENLPGKGNGTIYYLELQGVSADGQTAIFEANDSLEGSGAPVQPAGCTAPSFGGCQNRLYVKGAEGQPRYVCVLPNGTTPSSMGCSGGSAGNGSGGELASETGALSADAGRVFWSVVSSGGGEASIYVRENPLAEETGDKAGGVCVPDPALACTVAVSKAGEVLSGISGSHFWMAGADGNSAIYSTGSLSTHGADLYRFVLDSQATTKIAGRLYGVAAASADAGRVYFASAEAIAAAGNNSAGEAPREGEPNLYLWEAGGAYRFVATLAAADAKTVLEQDGVARPSSAVAAEPRFNSSTASADGEQLAFMSAAPLTGYDNTDAASAVRCGEEGGVCDREVFLYDAAGGGAGKLACVSCNPSGARPAGTNTHKEGLPFWVAARLPAAQSTLYRSRVLSAGGGRLFFESADALVPLDTNHRLDVYEWERVGSGCSASLASYSPAAEGCVQLVSSGQSDRDSEIVDASASGNDVFFTTLSSLVPRDDGLVDVYDARVGGGVPEPPPAPAPCEGEACQAPAQPPQDSTPGSLTFSGMGNVPLAQTVPAAVAPKKKTAAQTRAEKLTRALKVCRKRARSNRRRCEATARKRYASKARSNAKSKSRKSSKGSRRS